jgi:dUTP pyrophosphatase
VVSAYRDRGIALPRRQTRGSAGYDLAAAESVRIDPGAVALVPTGLKVYMQPDEVLKIYIRSSLAVRRHLRLANQVGIIDADYADNPDNEGHILIALENRGQAPVFIERGERIAQGIFERYLVADDDDADGQRRGGVGSTG